MAFIIIGKLDINKLTRGLSLRAVSESYSRKLCLKLLMIKL